MSKDEARGNRGMVAAGHPLAVDAGLDVLQRGGNAVDAAVTMAFALGVAEPAMSGIGGGGMMIIHRARPPADVAIDFAMDAPLAARPDLYRVDETRRSGPYGVSVQSDANSIGYRAVGVPGAVHGLALALERFGTVGLDRALEPAIRMASEGVAVDWPLALSIGLMARVLAGFPPTASIFLPGGYPLHAGDAITPADRLVQPDLARTLRTIAEKGPDAFYRGPLARALCEDIRQHGGLVTEEDLACYRATVVEPVITDYRAYRVAGVPGANGCITVQQSLNILDGIAPSGAPDAVTGLHCKAEAFRLAFADRYRYLADPKQVAVPWHALLSKEYAAERRRCIDLARAAAEVMPGDPWRAGVALGEPPGPAGGGGLCTAHLCVVDADRNVVTLTQTLVDYFGSGVTVPGTGVLLNNAMLWFDPRPDRPNSVGSGKRGLNNMAPLLVLRGDRPILAVGAPGGHRIMNALAQVIVNVLDEGMGIQDAITTPRLDCSDPTVLVDSRFPDHVVAGLERIGHRIQVVEESFHANHFARPVGILLDHETGRLHGGVDPFRIALAGGY